MQYSSEASNISTYIIIIITLIKQIDKMQSYNKSYSKHELIKYMSLKSILFM